MLAAREIVGKFLRVFSILSFGEHERPRTVELRHPFEKLCGIATKHRYEQNRAGVAFTLFDNRGESAERCGEAQYSRDLEVRRQAIVHGQAPLEEARER